MHNIFDEISKVKNVAITGHVRPDGDCIGSCTALYTYITNAFKTTQVDLFLESLPPNFAFLANSDKINSQYSTSFPYDVVISLDSGDLERIGQAQTIFAEAKKTINIDHHISNTEFAEINHVISDASSTCEVLFDLMEDDYIDVLVATSLYTGLIHDTGVFKHSNTTRHTMEIAGKLIEKGVPFSKIIDESFYQKTFIQNQILGRCLLESSLLLEGKVIASVISRQTLDLYGAGSKDIDGAIDQLRITKGVEVAILLHETNSLEYKVSMRSNEIINVSQIAKQFGGGGHIRAAGCTMKGTSQEIINELIAIITAQFVN